MLGCLLQVARSSISLAVTSCLPPSHGSMLCEKSAAGPGAVGWSPWEGEGSRLPAVPGRHHSRASSTWQSSSGPSPGRAHSTCQWGRNKREEGPCSKAMAWARNALLAWRSRRCRDLLFAHERARERVSV
ncbi:hypothetical protein VFPFJ_04254 [Purpureocillium lilacinum]|uniref:Uncharacterized protein n=1 Tax=Purpureocillium lilacinum TaxID=33203 RepID=A0A179GZ01_PURLI|nr:hypothetical protein VFPFJ_04254 [Purpureocillium lilacinum]OAQ82471.1 hypothetical protein VFPBJ_05055 [Purpureocillium lilacinum]OAQ92513.1 hypothetical protein VFPFJ_04254 [Purpureocillium lilacinum]